MATLTSNEIAKIRHPLIAMNDNIMVARYPPPVIASFVVDVVHIKDARAKALMRYHIAYFCDAKRCVELKKKFTKHGK